MIEIVGHFFRVVYYDAVDGALKAERDKAI
jgi:hypothetical protein